MRRLHVAVVVAAGSLTIPALSISAARTEPGGQTPTLRREMCEKFRDAVEQYAQLHRRLESPLPPEIVTADVGALFAPRTALARVASWPPSFAAIWPRQPHGPACSWGRAPAGALPVASPHLRNRLPGGSPTGSGAHRP